jgi:hypothetical protein
VAYSAERDRLLRTRGGGRSGGSWGGNGNGGAARQPVAVPVASAGEPMPAVMPRAALTVAEPSTAPLMAPLEDAAEESQAPVDAVPLAAIAAGSGTIEISFEQGVGMEKLLPAIESVTAAVRSRPGGVPVVINIPVAGATRQVRLPHQAEWDDRLADIVRQAAGVPVDVDLRAASVEG